MKALKKFFKKLMQILHVISDDYGQTHGDDALPEEKLPDHDMSKEPELQYLDSSEMMAKVPWWTEEENSDVLS